MNSLIIRAISMVGNHVMDMKNNPAKIGENFMPASTATGMAGLIGTAATAGLPIMDSMAAMDLHAMIGGYNEPMGILAHVAIYAMQAAAGSYSAYLVGKPRGEKL